MALSSRWAPIRPDAVRPVRLAGRRAGAVAGRRDWHGRRGLLIRHLYDKDPLVSLIVTFALALADRGADAADLGRPASLSANLSGCPASSWGPVLITDTASPCSSLTVLVLVGFWAFMHYTPYGRILRAGSRDPEMVGLLGIRLPSVLTGGLRLGLLHRRNCRGAGGAALDGLRRRCRRRDHAGVRDGDDRRARVVSGAVIAGLLVGVVTAMTIQFEPAAADAVMYVFMAVILLLRPRGLLGERWERFE